jgi:hypothetical protein
MLHIDPTIPATVLTLSRSKTVTTHVRDTSLKEAIGFVMERLPKVERSRSLIRTATHSLYLRKSKLSTCDRNFSMKTPASRQRGSKVMAFSRLGSVSFSTFANLGWTILPKFAEDRLAYRLRSDGVTIPVASNR